MTLGIKCDRCDSIAGYRRGGLDLCGRCDMAAARQAGLDNQRHAERIRLFSALAWRDGVDRALEIISGRDPATQADIAKWNNLGGPQ